MLKKVSERSQYLFIYERGIVNNDQRVRVTSGTYTVKEAILIITGEKDLQMKVIGNYILLYKELHASLPPQTVDLPLSIIIEGFVLDRQTREVLPHSYIVLEANGMGTVSNMDGRFSLKIPDSLSSAYVVISHIGYHSPRIPLEVFKDNKPEILLEPNVIQLQEIVARYVPAQKIVREMLENRPMNYASYPAHFTSFYREGVEYSGDFVSLTEGVCQIYKPGYMSSSSEQVKLLKMRNIKNTNYPDSILVKIQAGVRASLLLDVIQHTPDFLSRDRDLYYNFARVGMEHADSGMVHVVAFEQKSHVEEPLYTGLLYIDANSRALLKAEFEIFPRYVQKMGSTIILKKSKNLEVEVQKISYTVSYQQWNGYYWMNHARGDLQFKIKRKKSFFGSLNRLNAYFEMATCEIDTKDVRRFPNRERLSTSKIFSQIQFNYDADFWERFNTILPETKITEAIAKLLLYVEEQI